MNQPPPADRPSKADSSASSQPPLIPDYDLLRLIGKGGYGEVWLARNIMGGYRAVKVIYRRTFEHLRPYQREFEGIQRYEPVSRQHPSQVAILHVGRQERDEYYYYVMELADAETLSDSQRRDPTLSQPLEPASYSPRTLAAELKRRGKLPLDECISLGLSLATALEHLHQHGLIHRDIKPSNVIFVKGVPKLADIGLIAVEDSTVSFVGTRGYFPPEGPGTAQADLYSLGKVLYEISTGKDRNQFPDLPSDLEALSDETSLLEFNEILLQACHSDPKRRYRSAAELFHELQLLQAGKSVRQKRSRERLTGYARTAAGAALVLFCAGLVGFVMAWKSAPSIPRESRRLIVDPSPNPFFLTPNRFPAASQFDFSPDGRRIVLAGMKGLSVWDTKTEVNRPLHLPGIAAFSPRITNQWLVPNRHGALPRWAPDSQHFIFQALKTVGGEPDEPTSVWALFLADTETAEVRPVGPELPESERLTDLCWMPDGQAITCTDEKRRCYTLTLAGGRSLWLDVDLPGRRGISLGGYSPDGDWLVISTDTGAPDMRTDQDLWLLPRHGGPAVPLQQSPRPEAFPTWDSDGQTVYFVSSGAASSTGTSAIWSVRIDPDTGAPTGEPAELFDKAGQWIYHPRVVADGTRLAYAVDEPNTRIWMAPTDALDQAREVLRGQGPILSPDGAIIYYVDEPARSGIFAIDSEARNSPARISKLVPFGAGGVNGTGLTVSPDGASLAIVSAHGENLGIFIVPTAGGPARLLQEFPQGDTVTLAWSPAGEWLAYTSGKHLYRISPDGQVRELLATLHAWYPEPVCWSPDGRQIAALAYEKAEDFDEKVGVFIISLAERTWRRITPESEVRLEGLQWHPDGQRVTYHFNGPERLAARIRMAFLDGRPTEELIYQPDHWDYTGVWAPDGRRFFFTSIPCPIGRKPIHIYDAETRLITHALRTGSLPAWCNTGEFLIWTEPGESLRRFEVVEDLK